MSFIVAGRFATFPAAEAAAQQLFNRGFVEEDVNLFFVNPRGQHARKTSEHPSAAVLHGIKGPSRGATIGAVAGAIVGVAILMSITTSLVIAVIAAGVGAYIGSMIGATLHDRASTVPSLHDSVAHAIHHELGDSGVLVAVHVSPENQLEAATVLREAGGMAIERATGRWQQGRWSDFDPNRTPTPMAEMNQREA
ncbi:hypothetical protein FAZ95_05210 [Trinickia violacea]|uniref:Glycine zipper domain-containing protein n=1 Tax=Trinickia violacea TaxID=2571746 RepID=A0A4P8IIR5_9BURK|nr:hypothetical protein [Trinickia violacea]QCP48642.1 hypothetical protein FAZ95_05210 [Trinickia violacea]